MQFLGLIHLIMQKHSRIGQYGNVDDSIEDKKGASNL
jgi:hypothetical protein